MALISGQSSPVSFCDFGLIEHVTERASDSLATYLKTSFNFHPVANVTGKRAEMEKNCCWRLKF
jgi:hypothetical protein